MLSSYARISRWSSRVIVVIGLLLFAVALLSSTVSANLVFGSALKTGAAVISMLGAAVFLGFAANRFLSRTGFLIALLLLGFGLRLGWVLWINTPPGSDFAYMYNAAVNAANGDFSFGQTEYFASWVYQLGFTMYEAAVLKLTGGSILALKLLNIVFSLGTALVIYRLAAKLFGEFTGRIAALVYTLYIPNIIMCSVLTNQHSSTFFFLLGVLLVLEDNLNSKSRWAFAGLAIGIGNLLRPIGSIYLLAIAAYAVLILLIPAISRGRIWSKTARIAGIVVIFYAVQGLTSYALIESGITPYKLSNREPNWKFMVGLNAASNGSWTLEDAKYVQRFPLGPARDEAERLVIKERLANPAEVAALMARKAVFLWGSADSSTFWSLSEMNEAELTKQLDQMERAMYITMAAFGLIAMVSLIRKPGEPDRQFKALLLLLILLGYAAIHLAIEVQTRYRLDLMPVFIVLQSYGIYRVYERIRPYFDLDEEQQRTVQM